MKCKGLNALVCINYSLVKHKSLEANEEFPDSYIFTKPSNCVLDTTCVMQIKVHMTNNCMYLFCMPSACLAN